MATTETKTGHTPGEWSARFVAGAGWKIDAPIPPLNWGGATEMHGGTDRMPIAVEPWSRFTPPEYAEMVEANFRLFSAAPELLEACIALLRDIDSEPNSQNGFPSYAKAVSAITKANGGAR